MTPDDQRLVILALIITPAAAWLVFTVCFDRATLTWLSRWLRWRRARPTPRFDNPTWREDLLRWEKVMFILYGSGANGKTVVAKQRVKRDMYECDACGTQRVTAPGDISEAYGYHGTAHAISPSGGSALVDWFACQSDCIYAAVIKALQRKEQP